MTSFARKFPGTVALLAFGVEGFVAVVTGVEFFYGVNKAYDSGAHQVINFHARRQAHRQPVGDIFYDW